ncbi:hypothetical protein [Nostoc sp. WHI]|uniref:hypothetical protein n=1 Tax=Nostoc sp. WHI TaxID=2650611 RepID=UPI0018C509AE|nr:hypothetical protein [Nostoc sp. WHI]MBG1268765.1 hypothetical protein [Nostoc sp. WHI]
MKILNRKDAINRRHDERLIIAETAIYRVSCLNRTLLGVRVGMLKRQVNSNVSALYGFYGADKKNGSGTKD